MLTTLEQVEERINSPDNALNKLSVKNPYTNSGSKEGCKGRGPEKQAEAAALAKVMPSSKVAEITGYGASYIRDLKRGCVDNTKPPSESLVKATEVKLEKAQDAAVDRLMDALGLLTVDKMDSCDAKDLSGIAANMAKVAATGRAANGGATMNVIVYTPNQKKLDDYNVVDV